MGLIGQLFTAIFGGGRNVVKETAEVFRENAEAGAQRGADLQAQTLAQFAAEFAVPRKGLFDRFMDAVNRIPRPAMALGVLGLFVAAMAEPVWFSARMQGLALVPEPLWWLLGVIVSFYFGARYQSKEQDLQRGIVSAMARVPQVVENITTLQAIEHDSPGAAATGTDSETEIKVVEPSDNPAVDEWKAEKQRS